MLAYIHILAGSSMRGIISQSGIDTEAQALIDQKTNGLVIYEMRACPFCVKVRREIKRLGLNIKHIDVKKSAADMNTLVSQGGKFQVPCLRVESLQGVKWLYESNDIIKHLREI